MKQFAKKIDVSDTIIADSIEEHKRKDLKNFLNKIETFLRLLEKSTPWANKAELYIGLIKKTVRKDIIDTNSPIPLWDYCVERRARINNLTARNFFSLYSQNSHFTVTEDERDISNLCRYK